MKFMDNELISLLNSFRGPQAEVESPFTFTILDCQTGWLVDICHDSDDPIVTGEGIELIDAVKDALAKFEKHYPPFWKVGG